MQSRSARLFASRDPLTGQGGNPNIIFRIPTPLFGAGLIEAIPDSAILANMRASASQRAQFGISGHPNAHLSGNVNVSANDGTITRFGWKAQNKSLLIFAAEAYNVEMGVTNQLFPQERDETAGCLFNATPEDTLNFTPSSAPGSNSNTAVISDIEAFADFMRMLAPAAPRACHAFDAEWKGHFHPNRVRTLPYAFADHGPDGRQRLLDSAERSPVEPDRESILGSPRSPHGPRAGGRYHARQRRPG